MISFIIGLVVGANVALLFFALLYSRPKYRGLSECCNAPVEVEYSYRCLACGHYCRLKEESNE